MQSDTKSIKKGPFALKISFARCARDDGKLYFFPAAARRRKTLTLMAVWPGKLVPSLAIYDYHYVIGFVHVTDKSLCSKLASSGADALSQNLGSTSGRRRKVSVFLLQDIQYYLLTVRPADAAARMPTG